MTNTKMTLTILTCLRIQATPLLFHSRKWFCRHLTWRQTFPPAQFPLFLMVWLFLNNQTRRESTHTCRQSPNLTVFEQAQVSPLFFLFYTNYWIFFLLPPTHMT